MKQYKLTTTVRKALGAAPVGMCVGISDYSAQEGRVIACIAEIEKLINGFFTEINEPFLINPHTQSQYANPASDMHVLAAKAMYPELNQVAPWDLLKESKKDMGGWNRRKRGKILGFTLIYGGSANRISTALQVDIKLAEKLLNNYFNMFPELKTYIDKISTLGKYQKWVECPVTNRRYFIAESNSKGLSDDNTVERKACNILIQGISAIMTKKAAWYVDQEFDLLNEKYSSDFPINNKGRIVALVHDCVML